MNVFSLCFKSDKDLHEFLSYGEGNDPIEKNQEPKDEKTDINYQIENLINNSIGIRDSNSPQYFYEKEKSEKNIEKDEGIKREEKEEEIIESHSSIVLENKRTLFHKIFGPMEAGSIRGSIFYFKFRNRNVCIT